MPNIKERIEKASSVILKDFPDSDYEKVDDLLSKNECVDVWIMQGMGRRYLIATKIGENKYVLPIQHKLCTLNK